jgi:imidazole glycerol phosphate synthase glutamine amidotransferase subunit
MIVIIDYGMGNLKSVSKAFLKLGEDVKVSSLPEDVDNADAIVLPGVGAFGDCMRNLSLKGLIEPVIRAIEKGKPYLGICLGLQILFNESEEFGLTKGLGIIPGRVKRFSFQNRELKIPHMGWSPFLLCSARRHISSSIRNRIWRKVCIVYMEGQYNGNAIPSRKKPVPRPQGTEGIYRVYAE